MTIPEPEPGAARALAAAVIGVEGHLTQAHAALIAGPPGLRITGLPEVSVRETRDRVYAAVANSGQRWPARAVTVTMLPASLPRHGGGFDLAIAVALLTAAGAVPSGALKGCVFFAELGLDGGLRPVRGVVPALLAAARAGYTRAVVAAGNAAEAVMVPGLAVVPCHRLQDVLAWLRGEPLAPQPGKSAACTPAMGISGAPAIGLDRVPVSAGVRLGLEASAAGGHHLCLAGGRGARIPVLAAGLAGLLPALSAEEVMEVTAIHSAAGLLGSGHAVVTRAPLRAPHHTIAPAAMAGGGRGITRPGEAVLAHRGVLFLADAPAFARGVLQILRQPLEHGELTIARAGCTTRFPAKFILVAGMSPCPCGSWPGCACSPAQARRYRARLTGELGTYFSIWLNADSHEPTAPAHQPAGQDPDGASAARVAAARDRARHRLNGAPWQVNSDIPAAELRRSHPPLPEAIAPINRAVDLGEISARAACQVVRVAWTLADLAGSPAPARMSAGRRSPSN
jgi:magnesium chelatase family protein